MKILGVDLGSYSIKVAELDASSKGFVLNNFFEFPLSLDPNRDRGLQIIEALRGLSAKYDPGSTKWVIGVPQDRVSVHHKRFPFRERPKILKSLPFELEDDIPLDIDETIFDYKLVEFIGTTADVLTVACPKETIEETLETAKDGGFDPDIVGVEGLALANMFEHWNAAPSEVAPSLRSSDETTFIQAPAARARLILHIGHSRSILLVYRERGLVAVRSILWGGSDIAHAIARSFNVPLFEAVKVLNEKSFILMNSAGANQDQIRLSKTVSTQVDILLRDLKLILLEVKTALNLELESMELLGGTSQIQNLSPYLTQGLELPVNANTNALAGKPSRLTMTPQLEAVAPVAVGLAIEGMKRPRNPAINLRKGDFARENLTLKRLWETWQVPAQLAMAAFAIFFVYAIVRDQVGASILATAEEKLTEAAGKAAGLKGSAASESGIRKFIRTKQTLVANQEALSQIDAYISAIDILAKVSEKFPSRGASGQNAIDVTFFEVDNDVLRIKGKAQSAAVAGQIERTLNEVARPTTLKKINPDPGGTFAFEMKVNRKD